MLDYIKLVLRIKTNAFDTQLNSLIEAGKNDLKIAGVDVDNIPAENELLKLAIASFCMFSFGNCREYDRVKSSYDEQKAQLRMASGFTNWGDNIE